KTDAVFFTWHAPIQAGVSNGVDAVGQAEKHHSLMDVCDLSGIFSLDVALLQVVLVCVVGHALYIGLDGDVLQTVALHRQNADYDPVAHIEVVTGVSDPVPSQIPRQDGALHAKRLNADRFFSHRGD